MREAQAVGAEQRQAGFGRTRGEHRLRRHPLGQAGFREAGGKDHQPARASRDGLLQHRRNALARGGDGDAIRRLRKGCQVGMAGAAFDLPVARVDQVDAALETGEVLHHPRAEGPGA